MSKLSIDAKEYEELIKIKNLFNNLMSYTSDFIYFKDNSFNFINASKPFLALTQHQSADELAGKSDFDVFDIEHATHYRNIDEAVIKDAPINGLEESYFNLENKLCWVSTSKSTLKDEHGKTIGMFGISRDITHVKELENELSTLATTDSLTNLKNRQAFISQVEQIISFGLRENKHIALLFLDLDGFKLINDQHGHEFGDHVLKVIAERLIVKIRKSDTVCRWGGDEFIILALLNEHKDIEQYCLKIKESIKTEINYKDRELQVSCSIGVKFISDNSVPLIHYIEKADLAMLEAKRNGKGTFII
ncbi:sensor domain-containing diguanylate cyclase [Colwellia sp. MEBiC06753]